MTRERRERITPCMTHTTPNQGTGLRGWRRDMSPKDRLKADVDKYVEAIMYALGCEYRALSDVRDSKALPVARVNRILRRSSADALLPLVIAAMTERELIRVEGTVLYLLPKAIEEFERV